MIKVLIVEDETFIRKGLVHTFDWTSVGCIVIGEAEDGLAGLKLIQELSPDIVIADIRMPRLNGLEMIELASKANDFCSILLTGYSEFQYAKQAVSLKVFEYLLKPVDEDKLAGVLIKAKEHIQQTKLINALEKSNGLDSLIDLDLFLYKRKKMNYYVRQTLEIIESSYSQRLNINDIAMELGISKSYLSRKFKEQTNNTFVEFLNKYRINQGIKLLNQGNLRISQVATEIGFGQYKHFSKVFRRYMGMTPTEFLESNVLILQKSPDVIEE